WLEKVVEGGLGQRQLDTVEVFDGVAEVDEHEVALVSHDGVEGGLNFFLLLAVVLLGGFEVAKFGGDFFEHAFAVGRAAPGFPIEFKKLVEDGGAFDGKRYGRDVGQEVLRDSDIFFPFSFVLRRLARGSACTSDKRKELFVSQPFSIT